MAKSDPVTISIRFPKPIHEALEAVCEIKNDELKRVDPKRKKLKGIGVVLREHLEEIKKDFMLKAVKGLFVKNGIVLSDFDITNEDWKQLKSK